MMTRADIAQYEIPALRAISAGRMIGIIGALSAVVLGFLFWLIYFRQNTGNVPAVVEYLPAVNSMLNSLATVFLVCAWVAVLKRRYVGHVRFIIAALISSALFLVSYLIYHGFHGDTKFPGTGIVRPVYFFILISHILLSVGMLPMILTSVWLGLSGRFRGHRRLSRYTMPIWMYVSVTGVAIFVMLKVYA